MSQIFDAKGNVVPVTMVEAGPCFVTQVRTEQKDKYSAVQLAFGKTKHINKPKAGHLKKAGAETAEWMKEFRVAKPEFELGATIKADIFKEGDAVKVSGLTIGRGFTGVVKRHNFKGGPKSHGQKHSLRRPGSIGATFPERVPKGRRMGGRYGGERVTVRGLEIAKVDVENNILAIKGAVPGKKGTLLEIAEI